METFFVAGSAEDPAFAEAELLGDLLVKSFPRITFTKDMRHPCEWVEFRAKVCRLHGFHCPGSTILVWRRDGRLVGDLSDLRRVIKDTYNLEHNADPDLVKAIMAENSAAIAKMAETDKWTPILGKAKKVWKDGISFEGIWKDHKPTKGVVTFPDGSTYKGGLKDGLFHGHGKRCFANGGKFVGRFAEGSREGSGRYEDNAGNVYDGNYSRNACHSVGTRKWATGRNYTGIWNENEATGYGTEQVPVKVKVEPPEDPEPQDEDEDSARASSPGSQRTSSPASRGATSPATVLSPVKDETLVFLKGKQGEVAFPDSFQMTRDQAFAAVECYDIYVAPGMVCTAGATSRKFTEGHWDDVPQGLSFQTGGDYSAYFNSNREGKNNGKYTPVGLLQPAHKKGRFLLGRLGESPFPDSLQVPRDLALEAAQSVLLPDEAQGRQYVVVGDYQYILASDQLTWEEHTMKAKEWGGNLASINCKEENILVHKILQASGEAGPVWIGGTRLPTAMEFKGDHASTSASRSKSGKDDSWAWADDAPWSFTNWGIGQPANEGGKTWSAENEDGATFHHVSVHEDRVVLQADGTWKDEHHDWMGAAIYSKLREEWHEDSATCSIPWRTPSSIPPFGLSIQSIGDKAAHLCSNRERINDGKYTPIGMLPELLEPVFVDSKRIYRGEFVNGRYHGQGCMEYETHDTYEGEWINGQREGHGIYTWLSPSSVGSDKRMSFDGIFENDIPKYGLLRFDGDPKHSHMTTFFPGEIRVSSEDMAQWRRSLPEIAMGEDAWFFQAKERCAVTDIYDDYPIHDGHDSIMARVLTRDMWENLHRRITAGGITLHSCIAPGSDPKNTAHPFGLRASDPDCYTVFRELFDGVIRSVHTGFDPLTSIQPTDMEDAEAWQKVEQFSPALMEVATGWKLQFNRNIGTFPCAAVIDAEKRIQIERIVVDALVKMGEQDESLKGNYFPLETSDSWADKLGGMSSTEADKLCGLGALFDKADCSDTRDWPHARGVFITDDERLVVHVNKEDHVSFFCLGTPGRKAIELREMFKILQLVQCSVEHIMVEDEEQAWARSENLGILLPSLRSIGTGMTVELSVKLNRLTKRQSIDMLANETGLTLTTIPIPAVSKKVPLQDKFALSVPQKLGASEIEVLNALITGANQLSKHEKTLAHGRKKLWILEEKPKVLLLGAKEALADDITHASQLAEEFDLTLITPFEAVQAEIDKNTDLGQTAQWYRDAGKPVARELVSKSIVNMLKSLEGHHVQFGDGMPGWVCSGFPASLEEVEMLVATGIKPTKILSLKPDDTSVQKVIDRRLNRRREKSTKRIFYLEDERDRAQEIRAFPAFRGSEHKHPDQDPAFEKLSEDRGNLPRDAATTYLMGYAKFQKAMAKVAHVETFAATAHAETAIQLFEYVSAVPGCDPPLRISRPRTLTACTIHESVQERQIDTIATKPKKRPVSAAPRIEDPRKPGESKSISNTDLRPSSMTPR